MLKPIYLIHGDDDAKIDTWRSRYTQRAEADHGAGALEVYRAGVDSAEWVAAGLSVLSLDVGTRYVLLDGYWKGKAGEALLVALRAMPPDTVLVIIVRGKPPAALEKAVKAGGGESRGYSGPKPWELPKWIASRASVLGIQIDGEAAGALVSAVGGSQYRLVRELEKLAVAIHPGTQVTIDHIETYVTAGTSAKAYDLADAVVAGDIKLAIRLFEELVGQRERPSRLLYPVVGRLREVAHVLELVEAGERDVGAVLGMPPWRVKKAMALAHSTDLGALRRGVCRFADLEIELRGRRVHGRGRADLDEQTAVTLALVEVAQDRHRHRVL